MSTDGNMKMYAKNMRSFHNKVKQQLIELAVKETDCSRLLDIGCGRGGDLFKWNNANIEYVYGYDPNPAYIEEATRRFHTSKVQRNYVFSTVQFNIFENYFDVVSCQFAIHYMFASEETLRTHLDYVSRMLKPGGLYIGTFMDGDRVVEKLRNNTSYTNKAMCVRLTHGVKPEDTGIALDVHLTGTLYFGEQSVSHEFLVCKDVISRRCAEYGMRVVLFTPFTEYNHYLNFQMGTDFTECSYMYTSFIIQKIT